MAMQIGPAQTGEVTFSSGTVVPQEKDGIANDVLARIFDSNVVIRARNFLVRVLFELFIGVVGKDNKGSGRLEVYACQQ